MKTCTSCGETKPTTEFYRSAACADGFQYHCKACDREKNRRWYKANPDKNRENSRRHHEENQEKINERRRQFFAANREKETRGAVVGMRITGRSGENTCANTAKKTDGKTANMRATGAKPTPRFVPPACFAPGSASGLRLAA
jgi:hypothetical protein